MPKSAIAYLQNIQTHWDDVQLVYGYPGKYAVIARKNGEKWFVAGIYAEAENNEVSIPERLLKGKKKLILNSDAAVPQYITTSTYHKNEKNAI